MQRMMKQAGGFRPRLQIVEMEGHGRYFEVYEEGQYAAAFDHDGTLVREEPPYRVEGETFASVYGGRVAEVYGFRAYEAACAEVMARDPEGYDLSEVMPTPVLVTVRSEVSA